MTQAAGFYNTLLAGDDPALVIEVLNGYRLKERLPANIGRDHACRSACPRCCATGGDVTLVTYGACCRIALEAAELLARVGHRRRGDRRPDAAALRPAGHHRALAAPRPVASSCSTRTCPAAPPPTCCSRSSSPGRLLDRSTRAPRTLTAKAHRTAYGSDGDYFSKPNRETVFDAVYDLLREADPRRFPALDQ